MKTIEDYGETYRRCWAIYEALRRFGFDSDQIEGMHIESDDIVGATPSSGGMLALKLSVKDKEFIAAAGVVTEDHETVYKIWNEIGNLIMDENVSDESFAKTWKEFMSPEEMESLGVALYQKGIMIPKLTN